MTTEETNLETFESEIQLLKQELINSNYNVLSKLYTIYEEQIQPYTIENHSIALAFLHFGLINKDPNCLTIKEQLDKGQLEEVQQFFINETTRIKQNVIDIENQKIEFFLFEEKEIFKKIITFFNNEPIYEKLINYAKEQKFRWLNFILFMKQLQFESQTVNIVHKGFFFNKTTYKDLSLSLKNLTQYTTNNIRLSVFDSNNNQIYKSHKFLIEPLHNEEIIQIKNVSFDYDISKVIIQIRNTKEFYNIGNIEFIYNL